MCVCVGFVVVVILYAANVNGFPYVCRAIENVNISTAYCRNQFHYVRWWKWDFGVFFSLCLCIQLSGLHIIWHYTSLYNNNNLEKVRLSTFAYTPNNLKCRFFFSVARCLNLTFFFAPHKLYLFAYTIVIVFEVDMLDAIELWHAFHIDIVRLLRITFGIWSKNHTFLLSLRWCQPCFTLQHQQCFFSISWTNYANPYFPSHPNRIYLFVVFTSKLCANNIKSIDAFCRLFLMRLSLAYGVWYMLYSVRHLRCSIFTVHECASLPFLL